MKCDNCNYDNYPPCAIKNILTASALEDILLGKNIKRVMFPVCPVNAQSIVEKRITKTNGCIHCGLCDILCELNSDKLLTKDFEEVVFSNLNRFNILFSSFLQEYIVVSEVKAKGNARVKRIDVVVKYNDSVWLIKILSDTNKISYYSRSYADIINYYSVCYPNIGFKCMTIMPKEKIKKISGIENIYSFETAIKMIKGM